MKAKKYTIACRGETDQDLQDALDEAVSRITQGYTTGADNHITGSFLFEVIDVPPDTMELK